MSTSPCKACGSPIEYAVLSKSGVAVVLDRGEFANGYLEVVARVGNAAPKVVLVPLAARDGRPLRRAHRCPA